MNTEGRRTGFDDFCYNQNGGAGGGGEEVQFNKERLVSLIRLLGSPVDGEKLGAAYGIERILKAAGLSFHDLATVVGRSKMQVGKEAADANSWIDAGKIILSGKLSDYERKFVEDMVHRFGVSRRFTPTEKQISWFVELYRRNGGEGGCCD
jgi:hypothetical protein